MAQRKKKHQCTRQCLTILIYRCFWVSRVQSTRNPEINQLSSCIQCFLQGKRDEIEENPSRYPWFHSRRQDKKQLASNWPRTSPKQSRLQTIKNKLQQQKRDKIINQRQSHRQQQINRRQRRRQHLQNSQLTTKLLGRLALSIRQQQSPQRSIQRNNKRHKKCSQLIHGLILLNQQSVQQILYLPRIRLR